MALDFPGPPASGVTYIEDADGESYLNGLAAVTAMCWIKASAIGTDAGIFTCLAPAGDDECLSLRFDAGGASSGGTNLFKMIVGMGSGTGVARMELESSSNVQTTDWMHVCLSWTSGQSIQFFIDGVLNVPGFATAGASGAMQDLNFLRVGQGKKSSSSGPNWDGLIADFRIYGRKLTQNEVVTVRNGQGRDGLVGGLLVRYKLGEGSVGVTPAASTTVIDSGPDKNDALTSVATNTWESDELAARRRVA